MSSNLDQTIRALKKAPEAVFSVSSDLKDEAVASELRDVQTTVKRLLRQRRSDVAIIILVENKR
jgi:hypothetical protein